MNKVFTMLAATAVAVSIPTALWAATDGKNRRVTVDNVASQSIYYLYASRPVTK